MSVVENILENEIVLDIHEVRLLMHSAQLVSIFS